MPQSPSGDTKAHPTKARNADFSWDDFDASSYLADNYTVLRPDDRNLLELVRDFFGTVAPGDLLDGVDVGTGSNLYPSLALLPWCKKITMVEYSARNVAWLTDEIRSYSHTWDPFWDLLCHHPRYMDVADPRATLAARAHVRQDSVFTLPRQRWGIGTMFFVAESISSRRSEFAKATRRFLRALLPGAPFAAAFMEGSEGYTVGTREFPAVYIRAEDVHGCIEGMTSELRVDRIGIIDDDVLRERYTGMILARGLTRRQ